MQPPSRPHPPDSAKLPLRGDEAEFYRTFHRALERAVASVVNANSALIEDACQTAWTIFLRRQPDRQTAFGWLYVVARNEVYRLSTIQRREHQPHDLGVDTTIPESVSLDDQLRAREALRAIAQLPERQRRDLTLLVAGYSYRDIAHITGDRTYTNVNKHLVKARARIRQHQSADPMDTSRP